jgi:hypothetical protein
MVPGIYRILVTSSSQVQDGKAGIREDFAQYEVLCTVYRFTCYWESWVTRCPPAVAFMHKLLCGTR